MWSAGDHVPYSDFSRRTTWQIEQVLRSVCLSHTCTAYPYGFITFLSILCVVRKNCSHDNLSIRGQLLSEALYSSPVMVVLPSRQTRVILLVCLIILITFRTYRLPGFCIFGQCPHSPQAFGHDRCPADNDTDLAAPDAPFVSWPLARVCSETNIWIPGLVFMCDNNSGGIGNIRNFILTCLRYAIEAGATGLVMPTVQTRNEEKLADLFTAPKLPFSYFFDEGHFRQSWNSACPQIFIYDEVAKVSGLNVQDLHMGKVRPEQITPNYFGLRGGCDSRDLNRHADLFGDRFRASLKEKEETLGLEPVSARNPKLVRMNWGVQWNYPVYKDGPEFVATFGGLLKFRGDILELGRRTVAAMEKTAANLESETGVEAQVKDDGNGYLGVHLRTENDALSTWPSFEDQTAAYLAKATTLSPPLKYAYLATGNATEAAKFASLAQSQQALHVVTKQELLSKSPDLLGQLNSLSWDQHALVDFIVLLHADYFLGVSPSSFSMNVALKRHLKEEGLYMRPWKVGSMEGDGRSWLVGRYESYWDDWLFMYDSLWP